MSTIQTQQVELGPGIVWTVNVCGDNLQIVDDQGRERHRSRTHMLTGVYLASALADRGEFKSTDHLDNVLREAAKRFPYVDKEK